ncbi:BtrH N-terminal domain-containing protein [Flavobacterium muglaense]|uniref:BtrH N-terminal domain-containing protein n=1 Tax=Flavobacterium muglaense TaxID=2764716 RepID=A0A923MYE5_9FLAO|nr:BtrH N-terminal domain-containing protein [Flavobacterium muglaense]MBC5837352.1 BtrH N-terminal domain-containing protein [Flavobacterium muglaense]MBC5843916.1 BtrH N-terminal domain-containing protein [Flavobacterium muglaense]
MQTNFTHHQSAHCENGVASNLLKHNGLDISEPMVFGIGSGLFFVYLPFLKVNYAPAISYRPLPGQIFNKLAKRLGLKIKRQKFASEANATKALDHNLKNNIPSGLQVGVYNLSYFPDEYRFHFNAHNLVVYGKTETDYLISDPVMENVTTLTHKELDKVRFAKGAFAPRGQMYYPIQIPEQVDFKSAIVKGIKNTCRDMLAPMPIIGVRGIRFVSKQIRKWPIKNGTKKANHYLAQMVRMQEEIGTGGGGFRFIYAAFLEEASKILENKELENLSKEMTVIGDLWRDFAVEASRVYKNRSTKADVYNTIADQLLYIADQEEIFFKKLKKVIS